MVITAELAPEDKRYEIAKDGRLAKKPPAGARHGGIRARLAFELAMYVQLNQLGGVYGPDTSFKIGNWERMPDIAFISAARIPPEGEPETAWPTAPDLAIEVISPSDP